MHGKPRDLFSRPELKPLGIDLAEYHELQGIRTNVDATTTDGQNLHFYSRGDGLTIKDEDSGELIHDSTFGPYHTGPIIFEQICDLLDITVLGEKPVLSEAETRRKLADRGATDYSGRITYWSRSTNSSKQDLLAFADALLTSHPDPIIYFYSGEGRGHVRIKPDQLLKVKWGFSIGWGGDDQLIKSLFDGNLDESLYYHEVFDHLVQVSVPHFISDTKVKAAEEDRGAAEASKFVGRPVQTAGSRGFGSGWMRSDFATSNHRGEPFIRRISAIADERFSTRLQEIEIRTGEVIRDEESWTWYGDDLVNWCNEKADRYLHCFKLNDGRFIGYRPVARSGMSSHRR